MAKIQHFQTILLVEDMDALKKKTGESNSKEALARAVEHYLECDCTGPEQAVKGKKKNK